METRRLVLVMIFSISFLMLWDNYQIAQGKPSILGYQTSSPPSQASLSVENLPSTAVSSGDLPNPVSASEVISNQSSTADSEGDPIAKAARISVKTKTLELEFSTFGGQLVAAKLLNHPDLVNPDEMIQLFEYSDNRVYLGQIGIIGVEGAPNHRTYYEVVQPPTLNSSGDFQTLVFKSNSNGIAHTLQYKISQTGYDITVKSAVQNLSNVVVNPSVYVQMTRDNKPLESDSKLYSTFTGPAVYSPEKKYEKVKFDDIVDGSARFVNQSNSGWLAMVQHYFVSAIIPQEGPRKNNVRQIEPGLFSVGMVAALGSVEPGKTVEYQSILYTGPQNQRVLETLSPGLDLVVDYGWLTVVAQPIYWLLEQIHSVVGNWGWSIILLTVLIKALFFPLSATSYKSMAKMRKAGPRMQLLKEQFKDDKMGFQRAMMELYKREKINPLSGCMPIVIQIPVFLALYWVLLASVEMRYAPWVGWITDLASPDPYFILPIIMAVTMFIQTKLNPTPPDPLQAKVMMIMPLVFSFLFLFFPAGLVLYWVVNNILSIAQQWVITKRIEKHV